MKVYSIVSNDIIDGQSCLRVSNVFSSKEKAQEKFKELVEQTLNAWKDEFANVISYEDWLLNTNGAQKECYAIYEESNTTFFIYEDGRASQESAEIKIIASNVEE